VSEGHQCRRIQAVGPPWLPGEWGRYHLGERHPIEPVLQAIVGGAATDDQQLGATIVGHQLVEKAADAKSRLLIAFSSRKRGGDVGEFSAFDLSQGTAR
jgi:hypothetical protein